MDSSRHNTMRAVVSAILSLDAECDQTLEHASEARKNAVSQADSARDAELARQDNLVAGAKKEADQVVAAVESLLKRAGRTAVASHQAVATSRAANPQQRLAELRAEAEAVFSKANDLKAKLRDSRTIWIVSWLLALPLLFIPYFWWTGLIVGFGIPLARNYLLGTSSGSEFERLVDIHAEVLGIARQWMSEVEHQRQTALTAASRSRDEAVSRAEKSYEATVAQLTKTAQRKAEPIRTAITELAQGTTGSHWLESCWTSWRRDGSTGADTRIGLLRVPTPALQRLIPGQNDFVVPAFVQFPGGKSITIKTAGHSNEAVYAVQSVVLRLMASLPPGRIRFHFFDPLGLGQNVAGFMPLQDHGDAVMAGKPWTEPEQITEALGNLTVDLETVIQKYLQQQYKTIEDYNAKAEVPQPYQVAVVFDFPTNFTDTAVNRLISMSTSARMCTTHGRVMCTTQYANEPLLRIAVRRFARPVLAGWDSPFLRLGSGRVFWTFVGSSLRL